MRLSEKIHRFILSSVAMLFTCWIAGYFLFPRGKIHDQFFILLIVLPALWLLLKREISFKPFLKSNIFCLACAYCAYFIISTSWATYAKWGFQLSQIKSALYIYLFWIVAFTTLYLNRNNLDRLIKYAIISATISLIINVVVFYGIHHFSLSDRLEGFGRLRNALWIAAIYGAMAVLTLCIAVKPDTQNKPLYLSLFSIFFIATVLTHSRTAILAVSIVSAYIGFSQIKTSKSRILLSITGLALLAAFYLILSQHYQADINRGQSYRLDLWNGFFKLAIEHPYFGFGAGTEVIIQAPGKFEHGWSHYHNIYLGSFVELGIVGLTLHLVLMLATIKFGWQHRDNFIINTALMIFIFTCLVGITYGQGIVTNKNVQWIIFWLPLSIIIMHELELESLSKHHRLQPNQS